MPPLHPSIRTGQYLDTAPGIRLHYASAGEPGAPLMLFLHGFPEFWYAWRDVLPAFGGRWHAVAPDLRGFDLSSTPADVKAYRIDKLIGDVAAIIQQLGGGRCVLVAHDWGGAVAWSVAIARPDLVSKLVIVNAPHPIPFARALAHDPEQQAASQYMNFLRAPGSEEALAADGFAMLEAMLNKGVPARWFTPEVRQAYHANWGRPGALTGNVNYYRASPLYPPAGDDPGATRLTLNEADFTVRVPTRLLWALEDAALRPILLDGIERVVPDLQLVRIPGGTHWVIHEQPARVIAEIRDFVGDPA